MQGAVIKKGTKIYKSIIAQDAVVGENCTIGVGEYADSQYNKKVYCCDLVTVAEGSEIPDGVTIGRTWQLPERPLLKIIRMEIL